MRLLALNEQILPHLSLPGIVYKICCLILFFWCVLWNNPNVNSLFVHALSYYTVAPLSIQWKKSQYQNIPLDILFGPQSGDIENNIIASLNFIGLI